MKSRFVFAGMLLAILFASQGITVAAELAPAPMLAKYFKLINAHKYKQAFAIWELGDDHTNAAKQTLKSFTQGFADTASVKASIGKASDPEGAAGSVYTEVPVMLVAISKNGKTKTYKGTYTLRRSNVEGGHKDWEIHSAVMKAH